MRKGRATPARSKLPLVGIFRIPVPGLADKVEAGTVEDGSILQLGVGYGHRRLGAKPGPSSFIGLDHQFDRAEQSGWRLFPVAGGDGLVVVHQGAVHQHFNPVRT